VGCCRTSKGGSDELSRRGAEAYRRDIPDAEVRFPDTGHFALETHAGEIGAAMRDFLGRVVAR
jgi:pimeloyl-ACP methyl ester carboxylesterase